MQHRLLFAAQLLGVPDATALATLQAMQPTWPQLQPAVLELQGLPLGEWQAEHTRLFISGYPHTACPPFESFYRHGDLHGKAVDETVYQQNFVDDLWGACHNPALPIQISAFRHYQQWQIFLLLTPWMFSRLFVPTQVPEKISIPATWSAQKRQNQAYVVLGPAMKVDFLTGKQQLHLNYSPTWGHYLLHPLALSMMEYQDVAQVFATWQTIIATRNENLQKVKKQCAWQQEVSRRELFERFRK